MPRVRPGCAILSPWPIFLDARMAEEMHPAWEEVVDDLDEEGAGSSSSKNATARLGAGGCATACR
ncbi:hypothetical protein Ssi02_44470 [Sinosporangium siamense]|uniref:Uncharacterized protein n=1 Tax=Sinosporangium siamense TaxID=1367973 RepID=A0A919V8H1_9ACTN|nr:hypothetical protein Ssi02_44470 [Sinosporangium siamense]